MGEGIFRKEQAASLLAAGVLGAVVTMTAGVGAAGGAAEGSGGATGQGSNQNALEVLASPKTPLVLVDGHRRLPLTLVKRGKDGRVRVEHAITDRFGARIPLVVTPGEFDLKKDEITEQVLLVDGAADLERPVDGKLLLSTGDEPRPVATPVSIAAARTPAYEDQLLKIGAALGLASILFGAVAALIRFSWRQCMRSVAWGSNSWATNTAMASGVLQVLLALASGNDARMRLYKGDYEMLAAAFGVLAVVAPVLFNAIRRKCEGQATSGICVGFVLASAATMLATQLQLVLLCSLLGDLRVSATLPAALAQWVEGLVVAMMAVFVVYGNYSTYVVVKTEVDAKEGGGPADARASLPKSTLL